MPSDFRFQAAAATVAVVAAAAAAALPAQLPSCPTYEYGFVLKVILVGGFSIGVDIVFNSEEFSYR